MPFKQYLGSFYRRGIERSNHVLVTPKTFFLKTLLNCTGSQGLSQNGCFLAFDASLAAEKKTHLKQDLIDYHVKEMVYVLSAKLLVETWNYFHLDYICCITQHQKSQI